MNIISSICLARSDQSFCSTQQWIFLRRAAQIEQAVLKENSRAHLFYCCSHAWLYAEMPEVTYFTHVSVMFIQVRRGEGWSGWEGGRLPEAHMLLVSWMWRCKRLMVEMGQWTFSETQYILHRHNLWHLLPCICLNQGLSYMLQVHHQSLILYASCMLWLSVHRYMKTKGPSSKREFLAKSFLSVLLLWDNSCSNVTYSFHSLANSVFDQARWCLHVFVLSSRGCWTESSASCQKPAVQGTRCPSSSPAPFWVNKSLVFMWYTLLHVDVHVNDRLVLYLGQE